MKTPLPSLNSRRLRERRLELGLSEHGLARSLGVSPSTVRRAEDGTGDPANHDLQFVARYAAALGIDFADMFTPEDRTTDQQRHSGRTKDAVTVGAVLAASGGRAHVDALASAVGWPVEQVRLALDDIGAQLPTIGMRLVWVADTEVLIAPADGHNDVAATHLRRALEVTGLNVAEFTIIDRLVRTGPALHRASADPQLHARLRSTGLIRTDRAGPAGARVRQRTEVALTEETRWDLCLDESPHP